MVVYLTCGVSPTGFEVATGFQFSSSNERQQMFKGKEGAKWFALSQFWY